MVPATASTSRERVPRSSSFYAAGTNPRKAATSLWRNSWQRRFEMPLETTRFDIQDHLKTPEEQIVYLEAAFEDGDPALIAHALGDVARAVGMTSVAKEAGVTREALY